MLVFSFIQLTCLVAFRDIKPENLLLTDNLRIKVCDLVHIPNNCLYSSLNEDTLLTDLECRV